MLAFFVNIFLYPNIYYRAQKEKFQSNGWFAKIRAFSAIAHKFRSLRNFSSKNNAPILPLF